MFFILVIAGIASESSVVFVFKVPISLASAAIEVAKKTGESGTSIEKQIGEGVTWVVRRGVGAVRGLFA